MNTKERILILLLAGVNFTHILDFMVVMPLGNKLMPYFAITPQQFSFIVASYSISGFVSGLIAMFFVDRFDRKQVLLFGYAGFLIGTLCCGLAPSYLLLLISRIVAGLFGGIIGAQVLSIVADTFAYERRAQAMGFLFSAFSLASVVGVPLSLYLAELYGWHFPFFFIAGLGLLILTCLFKWMPSVKTHLQHASGKTKAKEVLSNILTKSINLKAFALNGTLMLGHFLIIPFLNPFMEFNVGFTPHQRNLIYMVGGLLTMFSSPLAGKLADKFGKHKTFLIFGLISTIPVFLVTNMPAIKYYYVLTVTGIWFIVSSGRNIPAQTIVSNVVEPQYRGSFQSFNSCITSAFVGMATLIAGAVISKAPDGKIMHYPTVGYLSIAVIIIAIFISRTIPAQVKAS